MGAGPLEDVVHKHGDMLVDAIENLAARDALLAHALRCVWLAHGVLRPSTELRLSKWITVTGQTLREGEPVRDMLPYYREGEEDARHQI